jgi:NADH dehydrogenase
MVENKTSFKKRVVVLGAGFAGIACAQKLQKRMKHDGMAADLIEIVLIDRNDYHLFQADLYEVATAYAKGPEMKSAIALPIEDLLDKRYVNFVKAEVKGVDVKKKIIKLDRENMHYDYLVVALGSETNYFGIQGLEKNSFKLKTLSDALKIHREIESIFVKNAALEEKREIYINVGGGGATGVEMAGELSGLLKKLAKKYRYPQAKINVSLIEGGADLAAMDEKGTAVVLKRLQSLGVKVKLGSLIKKVMPGKIFLEKKGGADVKVPALNVLPSDLLIWTGGVKVNEIVQKSLGSAECRGAIKVNDFLQSENDERIFAAGDNAFFGQGLGMFAQVAYQEGAVIGENLLALILKEGKMKKLPELKVHYLLPLGGMYAIWQVKSGAIYKGFFIWAIRRLVFFRYALSVLPFWKALRKLVIGTKLFMGND